MSIFGYIDVDDTIKETKCVGDKFKICKQHPTVILDRAKLISSSESEHSNYPEAKMVMFDKI